MVTRSSTRSKATAELPVHISSSKIFGRVDLLDQSGEVTQSWLVDSQSCLVGSASHAKIRIDCLAPVHASFVFGRRNTLVKCLQGVMTVGSKNVREYLIDEPTTIHLSGASLIVFPTSYVRNSQEMSTEEISLNLQQPFETSQAVDVAANSTSTVESIAPAVSSEILQAELVSSTVNAVQKSLEPLQAALTALTYKWDQLLHSVKAPSSDIADEIDRRFEHIEQQIPQLSSELGEMNGRLARSLDFTNSSMTNMASEIRERFDFISQRFDEKDDTRETSIDNTLSLLAEQLKLIQERLVAVPAPTVGEQQSLPAQEAEQHRSVDASEYDQPVGLNHYEQNYTDGNSNDAHSYGSQYVEQDGSEFQSGYSNSEAEGYSQDRAANYQSIYEAYSEEAIDESSPEISDEAEYVEDYHSQQVSHSQYADYSYESVGEIDQTLDDVSQQDDPSDQATIADSDLLSQAQNSDYNPSEYRYGFHSQVSEEVGESVDEDVDYPIEDRTPTASYTPIARSYSDAEDDVADEYPLEAEEDYAEAVGSKPGLPEWFTKDGTDAEQASHEFGNGLEEYSELESKLDSAVYQPIRTHDRSVLDEADVSSDFVIEIEPSTSGDLTDENFGDEASEDDLESEHPQNFGTRVQEPIDYALPDETEVEIEEDLPSAQSLILQEDDELSGSEELVDDEESVEQYMQRLLARVKGDDTIGIRSATIKAPPAPAAPQTNKALESALLAKSLMDSQEYAHRALSDEEYTPRSAAPESSLNLEAMRTLANETARTALAKSTHKPSKKHSNFGKLGISVFGFLIGTSILLVNGITMNVAFLGMICGYLIFLIWGFEATQNAGLTSKRS